LLKVKFVNKEAGKEIPASLYLKIFIYDEVLLLKSIHEKLSSTIYDERIEIQAFL